MLAVNEVLLLPGRPLLLQNSFGPVLVVPGVVGKVGEFQRKYQAFDQSKVATLLKTYVGLCFLLFLNFVYLIETTDVYQAHDVPVANDGQDGFAPGGSAYQGSFGRQRNARGIAAARRIFPGVPHASGQLASSR
jgi:hypothetical protein